MQVPSTYTHTYIYILYNIANYYYLLHGIRNIF